jgi:archaemetzincin
MQGSASIIEDARQPPYLCPVDLAKALTATGADVKERYEALLSYCDQHKDVHLFAGYGAWIWGRIEQMELKQEQIEGTEDHPIEID